MCGYRCCARRWRGRGLACGKRAPVRMSMSWCRRLGGDLIWVGHGVHGVRRRRRAYTGSSRRIWADLETAAHRIALTKADRKRLGTCSGDRSAPRSSRSNASWPSGRLPDSYQVVWFSISYFSPASWPHLSNYQAPSPKYLLRFTYHSWLNPAPTPVKPTFFYASLEISRGEAASYLVSRSHDHRYFLLCICLLLTKALSPCRRRCT
ncbi:hypothetical protein JB92DRAFT_384248 [Gautieria morchelliformis]|nr:hypothetical protein JB92DRAFT_384248 [Gautieria morchelliformis]